MKAVLIALALLLAGTASAQTLYFTADEIAQIARHGPWPQPFQADPSNRVSGQPAAIALGRDLFFDRRLSPDGAFACASCHDPARAWSEAKPVSVGRVTLIRNAPSLLDARLHRWFGWDGGQDSLWAMSLRPITDPKEMAAAPADIARVLSSDPSLSACYAKAFGRRVGDVAPDTLLVDVAKALAAFQETLDSPRSRFDAFRDAIVRGEAGADYPIAAQRGLRLFLGRGNCALCHLGPNFTNGEFHDIGAPFFTPDGVDPGRHAGVQALRASPFTLLGRFNDDPARATGSATRHLEPQHRNFGEFRAPSLRNVSLTAPYMHNGGMKTLRDVIRHYSDLNPDRLHADGEAILKPLNLSEAEIDDLLAFLETLTSIEPIPDGGARPACS